ncbi:MAG: DUF3592 domain-containing protein, partial [Pirellulales bacterium]|nr:DUF3592 domain-containing protein [Pirellulales bacterium]
MVVRTESDFSLGPALLVGIPFTIIGCFLLFVAIGMMVHQLRTRDWVEVPATVRQVELLHIPGPQHSILSRVACTYTYTFAGRGYEGNRAGLVANECSPFSDTTSVNPWYEAMYRRLKLAQLQNQTVPCFVNPDNPAKAVLDRDVCFMVLIPTLIFASAMGGVGLGVVLSNTHRFLRNRRRRRDALSDELTDEQARWKTQRSAADVCVAALGVYG